MAASSTEQYLARFAFSGLALVGLGMGFLTIGSVPDPAISRVAKRIVAGENYDPGLLRRLIAENAARLRGYCNPELLRKLVILQFSVADKSSRETEILLADKDLTMLRAVSEELLACSPLDSIAWLAEYWSEIRINGFGPKAESFLEQSYHFAPHEGWIQIVRAPLAFQAFEALGPALKEAALRDFDDILEANFFASAAAFYKSAPPPARKLMLDAACVREPEARKILSYRLTDLGLTIHHPCFRNGPL